MSSAIQSRGARWGALAAVLALLASVPAQAASVRTQIAELQAAMRVQKEEATNLRVEMDALRSEHLERTARVEESLDQLQRDMADVLARLEGLEAKLGVEPPVGGGIAQSTSSGGAGLTTGSMLADVERRLTALEDVVGLEAVPEEPAETAPESEAGEADNSGAAMDGSPAQPAFLDPKRSYEDAYALYRAGRYAEARDRFQKYLARFPDHPIYADNAQFWLGETYYQEQEYEKAILAYNQVVKTYPKGNKVPSALLKMGFALLKIDKITEGKAVLEKLVKEHPTSHEAALAKKRLAAMP